MTRTCKTIATLFGVVLLLVGACGPSDGDTNKNTVNSNNNNVIGCTADDDKDGICNQYEGCDTDLDTDGDGTPDCQDLDSDGDGISDEVELGPGGPGSYPWDADSDGTPDFQDLDSDGNGLTDDVDGVADLDLDGLGNFSDLDDDGDGISDASEMGSDPFNPRDTDGDDVPDYQDTDSDGDTILDLHEAGSSQRDSDGDSILDYLDTDSDNDGIPDSIEAGDSDPATIPVDTDGDGIHDYRDPDSDNDGLPDGQEDTNHNGVVDPGESDPKKADTDGDGVSDLIEIAAGTDPQNPGDNPQANGDFVFVVPYDATPTPEEDRLDFSTSFKTVDLYILEDVSGSMGDEITSVKNSLAAMLASIICGPGEDPAVDFCIPDVQTGAGHFGKSYETWAHLKDINDNNLVSDPGPDAQSTESILPTTASGGTEQHIQAMLNAATGTCLSDPSRVGTACFRTDSLGLIILISDEDFHEDITYNTRQSTYDTLANLGLRVVGVTGNDDYNELAQLRTDFMNMTSGTPAIQLVPSLTQIPNTPQCNALGGSPFYSSRAIVSGPDANAANAMTCAIQAVTAYLPQDVYTLINNDPTNTDWQGNPVNAVTSFVDYIEVYMDGSPECTNGLSTTDNSGNNHDDGYVQILPGTPVCWKLFVKENNTVEPHTEPQMFTATVEVHGEGGALLDQRDVFFLVPPKIDGPIIPK